MSNLAPTSESSESVRVEPFEWCDLPMELRGMCVRRMDFGTSMKLRRTSQLEKLIVESNKRTFDRLTVMRLSGRLYVYVDVVGCEQIEMCETERDDYKKETLVLSLLKYARISHLALDGFKDDATDLFERMAAFAPPVFPTLGLNNLSDWNLQLALEKFGEGVTLFDFMLLSPRGLQRVLRDTLLIPRILNAKHIQMELFSADRAPINNFIEHWLQYDKEVGSKIIFLLGLLKDVEEYDPEEHETPMIASFLETFSERVVLHDEEEKVVRIKTNNPEKHILMRVLHDEETTVRLVCQVIPMALKKDEYETTSGTVDFDR